MIYLNFKNSPITIIVAVARIKILFSGERKSDANSQIFGKSRLFFWSYGFPVMMDIENQSIDQVYQNVKSFYGKHMLKNMIAKK